MCFSLFANNPLCKNVNMPENTQIIYILCPEAKILDLVYLAQNICKLWIHKDFKSVWEKREHCGSRRQRERSWLRSDGQRERRDGET